MPARRPPWAKTASSLALTTSAPASASAHPNPVEAPDFGVVGVGASAGGLDACRNLVAALPAGHGMAFILVQHLDPTHDSMMVDLLAGYTAMTVRQAVDGMLIERNHFYIIPPGAYLSVSGGTLRLSPPEAKHGARLPFDFLLHSLAKQCGRRAICVILSGNGADGSLGLRSIKAKGGLVIAQSPDEAGFDGMPLSAIATGAVDLVLPTAKISDALIGHTRSASRTNGGPVANSGPAVPDWLAAIVDLLRTNTAHDFRPYKPGTLRRRIERRMGLRGITSNDVEQYLDVLKKDSGELDLLSKDLLINVTSFFRDAVVFEQLGKSIVPDLVRNHPVDQPLRVWVSGCSTGEEAYSLAMVFREALASAKCNFKLQVFASDIDPDAIATAREGIYSNAIEADVTPERLARFFIEEPAGYRVSPDLRATVTFAVQDILSDPPFSRLDLVSCRNLLIYLNPEAQSRVTTLFDFALREGGILLLGSSETISNIDGRFELVSKPDRIYRKAGSTQSGGFAVSLSHGEGMRLPPRLAQGNAPTRQTVFAELCRRHVLDAYAPAAVLINQRNECLYSLGPTHRYLRVAPGQPSHDLLAMASDDMRIKLRAAIQQAVQSKGRVVVSGGTVKRDGAAVAFDIDVRPFVSDGEELMLICFANEHVSSVRPSSSVPGDSARVVELEQELTATRAELQGAIRDLEYSSEEQRAINEEALSINEEFQSTNEELLTSKEELQSLNEELTALNGQLQETLERQRTTASDLQNVLYSTDVATLFLDLSLNIRFFTPACRALFNVIPSDVGRPLADLSSLSADGALAEDARLVLVTRSPIDREIEVQDGAWFTRRILPYRTDDDEIDGVVITFTDVTERKRARMAMLEAKQQAERATVAKSRFLAAASHDLRQPLQTIGLLQALLAKLVEGDKAETLVARLDETLGAMTGMLDALLDINRIEAGTVSAKEIDFPVNDLLCRLRDEYSIHAEAKHLKFHVVHSSAIVHGDPRLLEQMIRNLLSNAVKYTGHGRILLGCRRRGDGLSIEVWDTGIGIPNAELHSIFEEYHQIGNAARERNRGLGLGLSIVRRLGTLIGSATRVHSTLGKGSAFAIDVKRAKPASQALKASDIKAEDARLELGAGTILVVEDDPEVRDLLELFLKGEGHLTAAAADGAAAMDLIVRGTFKPDLVLADHNLPNDMNGLQLAAYIRSHLDCQVPVIILTGDISTETMREIARQDCVQLNKPVKLTELTHTIGRLLTESRSGQGVPKPRPADASNPLGSPTIFVVDDDDRLREAVRSVLEDAGCTVVDFATAEAFLASYRPGGDACILIDAHLPGISGIELLQRLKAEGARLSAVMITGDGDVALAVQAMKSGASDFIEKPIRREGLLACIERALEQSRDTNKLSAWHKFAAEHVARLTVRERQVMDLVLTGHPSKNIAADLGISQRTVENHRASIMKKTGVKSLPELVRMALAAAIGFSRNL